MSIIVDGLLASTCTKTVYKKKVKQMMSYWWSIYGRFGNTNGEVEKGNDPIPSFGRCKGIQSPWAYNESLLKDVSWKILLFLLFHVIIPNNNRKRALKKEVFHFHSFILIVTKTTFFVTITISSIVWFSLPTYFSRPTKLWSSWLSILCVKVPPTLI